MATAIQLLSAVRCKDRLWARIASLVLCSLSLNADSKAFSCFSNALATAFSVLSACSIDFCLNASANFETSLIDLPFQSHRPVIAGDGHADAGLGLPRHLDAAVLEGGHHVVTGLDPAFGHACQQAIGNGPLRFLLVAGQVRRVGQGPLVRRVVGVMQAVTLVRHGLPCVDPGPVGPVVVRL